MSVTTKSLYTQVIDLINKKSSGTGAKATSPTSTSDDSITSIVNTASTDDVIQAMSDILAHVVEHRIISGLEVTETNPPSMSVNISSGTGTAGGKFYTLSEPMTISIPYNIGVHVFYVNLYQRGIIIEYRETTNGLTLAKIIIDTPNRASCINNSRDEVGNGYIQSFKQYNLYGFNDRFEEDTVELLRDNIGAVLAENIIGNIRLSENLKIINTTGTLELNSDSLKMKDFSGNTLFKLDPYGIYFTRADGVQLAKFATSGARIGNIVISPDALESDAFVAGSVGFRISDTGEAEFNNVVVRGTIYATTGLIGGWSIADNELYATTTGTIRTSLNAGIGANGVVLDRDGLRVYDDVLGLVVNLPSDGSAPTFSSGIINSTIFNIQTNSVLRTSDTVGDGSVASAGILINDTGLYGVGPNQILAEANFKILANGDAYFKGELQATSGTIGGVTITQQELIGGLIRGSEIIGGILETSDSLPRVRIDSNGVSYQVTSSVGLYNKFTYNDGTTYGTGVLAFLFNTQFPILAVTAEHQYADIRLYNRNDDPGSGTGPHILGDIICVDGELKICSAPGSPGTFRAVSGNFEARTSDPVGAITGQTWIRTDVV